MSIQKSNGSKLVAENSVSKKKVYALSLCERYVAYVNVLAYSKKDAIAALNECIDDRKFKNRKFIIKVKKSMDCIDRDIEVICEYNDGYAGQDIVHCGSTEGPVVVDDKYLNWTHKKVDSEGKESVETWETILEKANGNSRQAIQDIEFFQYIQRKNLVNTPTQERNRNNI